MMAACTLLPITSEDDFTAQITSLPPTSLAVVYFHAPWAEPCKQMNTILSTLASTHEMTNPPSIAFFSLDAEELSEISEQYDVTQVPLVVLQKGGQVVQAITGTDAAKVRAAVDTHSGSSGNKASLPPAQKVTRPAQNDVVDSPMANGGAVANGGGETNGTEEDINSRLSELVKAAPVMLFMKGTPSAPQCGFSRQTVALLRERGVRYGFFNILADDDVRQGLKKYSDWPTFPQVYMDGDLIGGLDIVSRNPHIPFPNNL